MPMIAAAAGVSALGGIASAAIGANAQTSAAQRAIIAQKQALQQGYDYAGGMFGQAQNALSPYMQGGQSALTQLQKLTGTNEGGDPMTATLTKPFTSADFQNSDAFKFIEGQGEKSTINRLASMGLGSSGALGKGLIDYSTGMAGQFYNQQFQNYEQQNQQIYNQLFGQVQGGQGAASSLAGIAGELGQAGLGGAIQTGQGVGQSMIGQGNAVAGAGTGASNALTGGINSTLQYSLMQQLIAAAQKGQGTTPAPSVNNALTGAVPWANVSGMGWPSSAYSSATGW